MRVRLKPHAATCWYRLAPCHSLASAADAKMVQVDPYRVMIAGGKGGQVGQRVVWAAASLLLAACAEVRGRTHQAVGLCE